LRVGPKFRTDFGGGSKTFHAAVVGGVNRRSDGQIERLEFFLSQHVACYEFPLQELPRIPLEPNRLLVFRSVTERAARYRGTLVVVTIDIGDDEDWPAGLTQVLMRPMRRNPHRYWIHAVHPNCVDAIGQGTRHKFGFEGRLLDAHRDRITVVL